MEILNKAKSLFDTVNVKTGELIYEQKCNLKMAKVCAELKKAYEKLGRLTYRKLNGISGFPRMAESEYDAFGAGHASVSISAALGMVQAAKLRGESFKSIAVIGDGSMTGGLAFEGLNNAGADKNNDLLVILNDNNMAIDRATGALNNYLLRMSTSRSYNRFKQGLWSLLSYTPPVLRLCRKMGNAIKHGLMQNSNLFESFGFRYFGRVDGHDVKHLVRTLTALKDIRSPKLLHVITTKGHGYRPAEQNLPASTYATQESLTARR